MRASSPALANERGAMWHVVGPPGTGKTEYLARQVAAAVERHGPDGVLVTSLTKAAAVTIGARCPTLNRDGCGTLHSICYRADGGKRTVLDSPKGIKIWNEWVGESRRGLALSGAPMDPDDPGDASHEATRGDEMLTAMNLLRHRLAPLSEWPAPVIAFAELWQECMADVDATDFTGMVERGLDMPEAPGNPGAIIHDEAQDSSALEMAVIRQWSASASTTVLAGDEDQAIFEFRTGGGRVFADHPTADSHRRVLGQSYRVPVAVHGVAHRIIRGVPGRVDVPYLPTPEPGIVREDGAARWLRPGSWIDDVIAATREAETSGATDPMLGAMLLAPCGYMLDPALRILRDDGIPFANRYRPRHGSWNPLGGVGRGRRTGADQIAAFLGRDGGGSDSAGWTWAQLKIWVPALVSRADSSPLALGAKRAVERSEGERPTSDEFAEIWAGPAAADAARARDLSWLLSHATEKDRQRLRYPAAIARSRGVAALLRPPMLTVGTIHSTKGGQARDVFMLTALPPKWSEDRDSPGLHRMFYVGATRASRSLVALSGDRGGFAL